MKKSHLYSGPPSFKADEWEREDAAFFGQLLNIMESKIHDLVIHTSTLKEMWNFLRSCIQGRIMLIELLTLFRRCS